MPADELPEPAAALDAAVANAGLEGIKLPADERELIRRHQRGEIDREEFLEAARRLAEEKGGRGE